MTRTTIPVSLPVPNPTKSYWQTPEHPLAHHRTTPHLPSNSTYTIIGSGITGSLIAYKLLQHHPNAQITILEARTACSGATGRNGGHCRAGWYLNFAQYVEKYGEAEALKLESWEESCVRNVGNLIKELGIECDLRAVETVDITEVQSEFDDILAALKKRDEVHKKVARAKGEENALYTNHKVWSKDEARKELLIPKAVGAVSYDAFVLSPYKFICGLLTRLLSSGKHPNLNLQTTTPATEIEKIGGKWAVKTPRGTITSGKLILATNAYTSFLYPPLSDWIIPTRGQLAAVRAGSKIAGNPALKRSCGLNSEISGDYMQTRQEPFTGAGDVLIGGGRRLSPSGEQPILDDSEICEPVSKWLLQTAPCYFGRDNWGEDGEVVQEWTGIMGYTQDHNPCIGEVKEGEWEGLFLGVGFHGHGMALAERAAEAVTQILLGNEKEVDRWLPKCYRLDRVPPVKTTEPVSSSTSGTGLEEI
ncbi:FAD dependent oxidoreductase superfamily protein [Halenospora varia]|nr:FAD dependent oxidoreductase superfamily protein [Halenospora varia]